MAGENYNPLSGMTASIGAGFKATAPASATPAQTKTFTTGVDKAQADFNKSLADAKNTLAQANKQGNKVVAASAKALIDQLNTVVKPALAILQKAENPNAAYTGDITPINKSLGGGPAGSGPTGAVLGTGGKGAYSLEQIRSYMDANNGAFPPDLNTIASGITAADLTNLVNQYESGTPMGGGLGTGTGTGGTPAASTSRQLAVDAFKNAFGLVFGIEEANKPYVSTLYGIVSGFYKSGSTIDEAINLSIRQARVDKAIPEFTNRFAGIFALEDKLKAGYAVDVPTIADFIKSEAEMGDLLRQAGMADLATQEFLGDVIGRGKSVAEVGRILSDAFYRIDNAPQEIKAVLATNFPTASRVGLAKALIAGEKGAAALEKEIKGYEIVAAAKQQGFTKTLEQGMDLSASGYDYSTALTGYGQIAAALPVYERLQEYSTGQDVKTEAVQAQLESAVLKKTYAEQEKLRLLSEQEVNRFRGSSGTAGSKSFASQARGAGLI
jgi:hypothetical protein